MCVSLPWTERGLPSAVVCGKGCVRVVESECKRESCVERAANRTAGSISVTLYEVYREH